MDTGKAKLTADGSRIQVLMTREEAERFERYCLERGYKKSTLIARLIREHLDQEKYRTQRELLLVSTSPELDQR